MWQSEGSGTSAVALRKARPVEMPIQEDPWGIDFPLGNKARTVVGVLVRLIGMGLGLRPHAVSVAAASDRSGRRDVGEGANCQRCQYR